LAANDELGGLFGLLEAANKAAGLIGPLLAGLLASANASAGGATGAGTGAGPRNQFVLTAICAAHLLNIGVTALFYHDAVTECADPNAPTSPRVQAAEPPRAPNSSRVPADASSTAAPRTLPTERLKRRRRQGPAQRAAGAPQ